MHLRARKELFLASSQPAAAVALRSALAQWPQALKLAQANDPAALPSLLCQHGQVRPCWDAACVTLCTVCAPFPWSDVAAGCAPVPAWTTPHKDQERSHTRSWEVNWGSTFSCKRLTV